MHDKEFRLLFIPILGLAALCATFWTADIIDPGGIASVFLSSVGMVFTIGFLALFALDLFGIEPPPHMEGKSLLKPQRRPLQHEVAA